MNQHPNSNGLQCTLTEVARELGVSRSRAQQIEQQALEKARNALERRGLTLEDLLPNDTGPARENRPAPWNGAAGYGGAADTGDNGANSEPLETATRATP